ncbi:MAG TPA: N-acetyl-gamma-glutamyl-phosphate reductase [Pseudonocardiaceae bacterium]|nr:N-acetyl-gamma-glutamyl-phosphate reductase [Pseudonocardiaceae bacterium]
MGTSVAVVGGSGYIGGELLRLLLGHPDVQVTAATSTRWAGRRIDSVHPNLRARTDLTFTAPEALDEQDVVFLAAPRTAAMAVVPELRRRTRTLIDLGPDFRLRDPELFHRYYGVDHTAPDLLPWFVSGIPELHRTELSTADLISIPGCMAVAATLALRPLAPLVPAGAVVTVDGRIGSSGSGAGADQLNRHAERSGALRVFAATRHRHEAEVGQATGLAVRMTATGVEAVRGAQVVCRVPLAGPVSEAEVRRSYRDHYAGEPFVRVVAQRRGLYRLPEPKILIGSNYCDVGFAVDGDTVVAIGALDNLVKGGAGNAVQCMNIRLGRPERTGLDFAGLHPI